MSRDTSQGTWQELGLDVLTGMREWRQQHSKATFREIEGALDDGFDGYVGFDGVRREEGKAANPARLQGAGHGSGELAQIGGGEIPGFASANQQQALGFEFCGSVDECGLEQLGGDVAGGQHGGGGGDDGGVTRL